MTKIRCIHLLFLIPQTFTSNLAAASSLTRFASLDGSIESFIEVQENQKHCKEDKTGRSIIERIISKKVFMA